MSLTDRATFGNIPAAKDDLFEVRAGLDAEWAITKAACLAESIEQIASDAVENGMSAQTAHAVAFIADAIGALTQSVEGVCKRKERP